MDCALEEDVTENRIDSVRRVIMKHLGHILIEIFLIDVFEADYVRFGEVCPMTVVEGFHDF